MFEFFRKYQRPVRHVGHPPTSPPLRHALPAARTRHVYCNRCERRNAVLSRQYYGVYVRGVFEFVPCGAIDAVLPGDVRRTGAGAWNVVSA